MKINKEKYVLFLLLLLALLPNIISYFYLSATTWLSLITLSIALILLPAIFLKRKIWLFSVFFLVLLSPLEIVTLVTTHSRINNAVIASIFSTSQSETLELLSGMWYLAAFFLFYFGLYIFLLKKITVNTRISRKYRWGIISLIFLIIIVQFFNSEAQENSISSKGKQTISDLKRKLSYEVFPTNLLYNTAIFAKERVEERIALKNLKNFNFKAVKLDRKPQIVIFVLGESSRVANWSLFGYEIKTNPLLQNERDIFTLSNTYAATNSTYRAMPMLLTNSTPVNPEEWKRSGTVMKAFKEAGYNTAWFGGQSGNHNIVKLANRNADIVNLEASLDQPLFEKAKNFIKTSKRSLFIIIHTNGSHYDYKSRYPKKFEIFKPANYVNATASNKTELINAYNNSVLFTDFLLSDMINFLKTDSRASSLFYTSDHGENLLDDKRKLMYHVQSTPTKYELHVPSLIWFSDTYRLSYSDKVKNLIRNKDKKMSTTVTFHTLLDMGNIKYPSEEKTKSVISPDFQEFKNREILTNLKNVIVVD
jgi:glucan phosphoethanolaminetransferase (alkaline phosphatase superfamily)